MTEKVQHSERDHYLNGGSSITRRKYCRGSLKMELPFWKQNDSSADATAGTRIHECGELLIPTALANWNKEDKFEGAPTLKDYTESEIEAAQRYCLDILRLVGSKVPHVAWVSEQRFDIDPELELGGTADFAWGYIQPFGEFIKYADDSTITKVYAALGDNEAPKDLKVGHIWDYKNGTIPHNAKSSEQIKQYVAGLQHKLGSKGKRPFDVIFGHVYGPNFRDKKLITSAVAYTATEIDEILKEQRLISEEALGLHGEGPLKLSAGEHCFFCKAKAVCPEFDKKTRQKASLIIDQFDAKYAAAKKVKAPEELETIDIDAIIATKSDADIKEFWMHIEFFSKAISAVKDYIRMRHLQGKPIEGLKVVQGTTRRIYKKDLDDLGIGKLLQDMGIEKPWQKVVRNLTDVEKELKNKLKESGLKAKDAEAQAKALLMGVVEMTTPALAIALDSETDPRVGIDVVNKQKAMEILDAATVVK